MTVEQGSRRKRGYVPLFAVIWLFVLSTSAAFATDFTVTTTADIIGTCPDATTCSLRSAIIAANLNAGPDRIILASGQIYTLSRGPADASGAVTPATGDLDITGELTIDGNNSTVDANSLDRVFDIQPVVIPGSFLVTINDLTIKGGSTQGFLSFGGGINIRNAEVVLNHCTVQDNVTTGDPTFGSDNGGGISVAGLFDPAGPTVTPAKLTLNDSTVKNNTGLNGGGILCVLCELTVTNSRIFDNTATGSDGGGIDLVGDSSKVTAIGSALATNHVTGPGAQGGGLSMPFGAGILSSLTRTRIVSNTATTGSGIFAGVATVAALNNWWGCNFGPGVGDGNVTCAGTPNGVSGGVTTAPFLRLQTSASPTSIPTGGQSTVTADLTFNSDAVDTSAGGTVPNGIVASFSGTLGTFATPTATTVAGKATDVYTAGATSGTATLSAVVDGQTKSTTLTVVNAPPTLDAIPDPAAILEDAALQTVNLAGISAGGGEVQTLTVTALSNNTGLIPNPTVTYTSPNATGSLSYTPVANANGSAIITVTVTDSGGGTNTFSRTFTVNVTAVNDPPTLDAILDPTAIAEDAALQTVNLAGIGAGGGESQTLTVTASSDNTGLIPNPTVSYTSPNATGSLSYTPVANASGSAIITVTVDDGGSGTHTVSRTFTVVVNAVNDPPTLDAIPDPAAIAEDAALQTVNLAGIGAGGGESQTLTVTALSNNTGLIPNPTVSYTSPNATGSLSYTPVANASGSAIVTVTVDDGGSGTHTFSRTFTVVVNAVNDPPTLDAIPDPAAIAEDAALQTVNLAGIGAGGGESQTLTITALSDNTGLIPNPTVSYTSPNATGSLSYTPVANASGSAIITVTVDDGGTGTHTVSRTFTVVVNAVNDPPTLNAIANPSAILEDAALQTVNLSGITAGGGETGQTLTVTALSNNTGLIPNPTVSYTSPNATGSLSYTPVANASGSAIITVTVTDDGGGTNTFSRTFTVNVTAVNDPPTLNAIPDPSAIPEDAGLQTVNLSGIAAGGGESQTLTVTALSNNTGLIPNPTVTYTSPNATGSLSYTPVANASGSAIITVTVDDGGTEPHTVTRTFTVNVTAVNDPPTIAAIPDQFVPMNGSPGIPITIGDVETAASALVVTATSSNQTVVPNSGLVVGPGGTSRTLTVTPAPNQSGTATITVTVDDGTGQASTSFVATVATGLSIADATMAEGNSGTANLSVTVSLTGPSPSTVSAHYATRQRTAIEGVDYLGVAGTVSFAPGATTATILVPVVGDLATEIDETFFIELSAAVGGVITRAQAVGTIANDDPTTPVTAEVVAWGRRSGVTSNGGTLTKTAGAGWSAAASSTRAVKTGDGSVEFSATAPDQTWVVGLSRSVSPFLVVTDIEFGLELFADGTFAVVEHGVNLTGPLGTYVAGDRFAIAVTGGVLRYHRNGVTVYTSAGTPLYPLRVDAALFTPGSTIADVVLAGRLVRLGGAAGDVDNDGKSDFTVFRASTGGWHTLKSSTNYTTSQSVSWGLSTDVPVPGDYDGDGQMDPAIYRPSTGLWAYLKSSTNYTTSVTVSWGLSTDVPVPADYDGDGKTDPTVYRPSTGGWYVLKSSTNYTSSIGVLWGLSTDLPVPGDYDGDGQADPAIYRPSTGLWAYLKSTTSYTTSATVSWGLSTDVAVPGDYDGDGKTDPAVFRASTGGWHILKSSTNYTTSVSLSWGLSTDVPVPADYDGDGRFDPAIFRPSAGLWAVLKSSTNYTSSFTASWGLSTDVPINKRP